jgi:hypothetical protein
LDLPASIQCALPNSSSSQIFTAGKDVYWYTREKKDGDDIRAAEIQAIKEKEEELMAEV